MLLAIGSSLLDTTVRTVVVGLLDGAGPTSIAGADALWLPSPTPERVAATSRDTGLPVGVTLDDLGALGELVAAGAVAIECASLAAIAAARDLQLTMWCSSGQAARAVDAGVAPERIVREQGWGVATAVGVSVVGHGPGTWGEVVRATRAGARVVRTTDVAAVRRVVSVLDRLAAERSTAVEVAS